VLLKGAMRDMHTHRHLSVGNGKNVDTPRM